MYILYSTLSYTIYAIYACGAGAGAPVPVAPRFCFGGMKSGMYVTARAMTTIVSSLQTCIFQSLGEYAPLIKTEKMPGLDELFLVSSLSPSQL